MDELHDLVSKLKQLAKDLDKTPNRAEFEQVPGVSCYKIRKVGGFNRLLLNAGLTSRKFTRYEKPPLKILIIDIETSPIRAKLWRLGKQVVTLDQLDEDWYVMAWAAKWLGDSRIFYSDQSEVPEMKNDKKSMEEVRALLLEADVVITQNGISFDLPKLMTRFFFWKLGPIKKLRQWDNLKVVRRIFGFTSNKLAHLTNTFNEEFKKLEHEEFPGRKLWDECEKRNPRAWKCMKDYNIFDVLALEEFCLKVLPWDTSINWSVYTGGENYCVCGSVEFVPIEGQFHYTNANRFQLFQCKDCGSWHRSAESDLGSYERKGMLRR